MSDDNLYAPPEAEDNVMEREDADGPHRLASRWARLGAYILDMIILLLVMIPLAFVFGLFNFSLTDTQQSQSFINNFLISFLSIGVFLALNGYLLAKKGQTIGKLALGIRIVDHLSGKVPPFSRGYGMRYLAISLVGMVPGAGPLFALIDILFIFSKNKRCIHDMWAKTSVVKA